MPPDKGCFIIVLKVLSVPFFQERNKNPRNLQAKIALGVVVADALDDLLADGHGRIQAAHRILKDHRHVVPTQRTHLFPIALQLIDSNIALVGR